MNAATVIRHRALSALIIGATGRNVLRVVTAFEAKRILTLREDTIATACERIAIEMPHVVLLLVTPANAAERDALNDRALAVGALTVEIDPEVDGETFKDLLDGAVTATLKRKLEREAEDEARARRTASDAPSAEIDAGWSD